VTLLPIFPLLADAAQAVRDPATLEFPLSVIISIGLGLVSAVVFIFRLLIVQQERRLTQVQTHHEQIVAKADAERLVATQDRGRYSEQLERLVTVIAADRLSMQEQMIKTVAANTLALTSNTEERKTTSVEAGRLMKDVADTVIIKLVDLGLLAIKSPAQATQPISAT
jgi:hypothetical protein